MPLKKILKTASMEFIACYDGAVHRWRKPGGSQLDAGEDEEEGNAPAHVEGTVDGEDESAPK